MTSSDSTYTTTLSVTIGGVPLTNQLSSNLMEGWIDSGVSIPSAFQLTFNDPAREIVEQNPEIKIGSVVTLIPFTNGKPGPLMITGEITALEADSDATGKLLVVRGYDRGHRLLRNRRVAGYPNMTATDIVRKVAALCDVTPGVVDQTTTVYELATQPNITDWDFLSRLARENGVYLYVDALGLLQFTKLLPAAGAPSDTTTSLNSPDVLEFETNAIRNRVVVTASDQVDSVEVRGWNVQTKTALSELTPGLTTADVSIDTTPGKVTEPFGTAKLVSTEVPYDTQAEVLSASAGLAGDVTSAFAELEVIVKGNPVLRPGLPVALNGAGNPFQGKYTITGTRHVFTGQQNYHTTVMVTGRQVRSLYGLASGGADTAPKLPGVASALVTNIQDPLHQGRVKLMFPWLSADYESDWCRVAQLGGVKGGGTFLPEVHDEVLCAFDRGQLDHPYVIAGLYNGVDQPTRDEGDHPLYDPVSGAVNWRSISSRTGHMVELLDVKEPISSGIRAITAKRKLLVHLDEGVDDSPDATITISSTGGASDATVTISNTGAITVHGGTSVTVRAGADLSLQATGKVSIEGASVSVTSTVGPATITSPTDVSVTGGMSATVTGAISAAVTSPLKLTLTAPLITSSTLVIPTAP
ncbi:VgrG-related protein [Streptacidiphilus sp. P02-A3a]|uniref:VgrG-related protein n=1 Tax=Streptacidiphilus sp. P02-A3a TaxID=2704468 RepID=UPI0015FD3EDE|nr:VgrG-related protein [Streptacidiphilus sp. P02-A3a]QMU71000.1 VgrG-related protein [Streptacidiphilus sp. P02-A3a]